MRLVCILAALSLTSCTTICHLVYCSDAMSWSTSVCGFGSCDLAQSRLAVCRNDECVVGVLDGIYEDEVVLEEDGARRVTAECQPLTDGCRLSVQWVDTGFTDGDRWSIVLTDQDGEIEAEVAETAVDYDEERPNGPGCDPECHYVTLE